MHQGLSLVTGEGAASQLVLQPKACATPHETHAVDTTRLSPVRILGISPQGKLVQEFAVHEAVQLGWLANHAEFSNFRHFPVDLEDGGRASGGIMATNARVEGVLASLDERRGIQGGISIKPPAHFQLFFGKFGAHRAAPEGKQVATTLCGQHIGRSTLAGVHAGGQGALVEIGDAATSGHAIPHGYGIEGLVLPLSQGQE
mmetsp:Transcript_98851/g.137276  ORF Transcript_98851/g.137276 Transcript_98851/m.137276 type:complete len:201 (+) Transcript_98851:809-1411(+)